VRAGRQTVGNRRRVIPLDFPAERVHQYSAVGVGFQRAVGRRLRRLAVQLNLGNAAIGANFVDERHARACERDRRRAAFHVAVVQSAAARAAASPARPAGRVVNAVFMMRRGARPLGRVLDRIPDHAGPVVPPANLVGRQKPRAAAVVIALDEQVRAPVAVGKHSRVAGLGGVPVAGLAVGNQRLSGEPPPVDAVLAGRAADLLRVVVVPPAVEQKQRVAAAHDGRRLDAARLPRQLGPQDGAIAERLPRRAAEAARQVGGRGDQHLRRHRRIARGVEQDQPTIVLEGVAVDRAAAGPIARGPQDRVARIACETQPVVGDGVAQRVVSAIPIGVVEQMHPATEQDRFTVDETVLLALLLGQDLADLAPVHEVAALGDTHGPTLRLRFAGGRRHRVVHQVAPAEFEDGWVFRERPSVPRGVAEQHAWPGGSARRLRRRGRRPHRPVVRGRPVNALVGRGLADGRVLGRFIRPTVGMEQIVEPDRRLGRAPFVIPGELALRPAVDEAPVVAAHPFGLEQRQVGVPAAALQPGHPLRADDRPVELLQIGDAAPHCRAVGVEVEARHVGFFEHDRIDVAVVVPDARRQGLARRGLASPREDLAEPFRAAGRGDVHRLVEQVPRDHATVLAERPHQVLDVGSQPRALGRIRCQLAARRRRPTGQDHAGDRLTLPAQAGIEQRRIAECAIVEQDRHDRDPVLGRKFQEDPEALLEAVRVVFPDEVLKEGPRRVEAELLRPTELTVDGGRVEPLLLPPFGRVAGGAGYVVETNQPRVLLIPLPSPFRRPAGRRRGSVLVGNHDRGRGQRGQQQGGEEGERGFDCSVHGGFLLAGEWANLPPPKSSSQKSPSPSRFAAIQARQQEGKPLHYTGVEKVDSSLVYAAKRHLGSWDNALAAAGAGPQGRQAGGLGQ